MNSFVLPSARAFLIKLNTPRSTIEALEHGLCAFVHRYPREVTASHFSQCIGDRFACVHSSLRYTIISMKNDLVLGLLVSGMGVFIFMHGESLQIDDISVAAGTVLILIGLSILVEYFGLHWRQKLGARGIQIFGVIALAWIMWTIRDVAGYVIPVMLISALFIGMIRTFKKR